VLAYKDEYEVARLYTDGDFLRELASQFDGDYQLRFHIGASWVTGGVAKKIAFGPWLFKGMKLLARCASCAARAGPVWLAGRPQAGTPLDR
jgi:indolepyruvate ferredoxin oxidoreductase